VLGEAHLGRFDAYVAKHTTTGELVWLRQFGTDGDDNVQDLLVDELGNVYASGRTSNLLPGTPTSDHGNLFLRKYDPDGNLLWSRQEWNTSSTSNLAFSKDGSILVLSSPELTGPSGSVNDEFEISSYDGGGNKLWSQQFGETGADWRHQGFTVDSSGDIFVAVQRLQLGQSEALLVKLSQPVPEPTSSVTLLVGLFCLVYFGRRCRAPAFGR
jgi:hypothetical protein